MTKGVCRANGIAKSMLRAWCQQNNRTDWASLGCKVVMLQMNGRIHRELQASPWAKLTGVVWPMWPMVDSLAVHTGLTLLRGCQIPMSAFSGNFVISEGQFRVSCGVRGLVCVCVWGGDNV